MVAASRCASASAYAQRNDRESGDRISGHHNDDPFYALLVSHTYNYRRLTYLANYLLYSLPHSSLSEPTCINEITAFDFHAMRVEYRAVHPVSPLSRVYHAASSLYQVR